VNYTLANPPFNISDWCNAKLEGDKRWAYGNRIRTWGVAPGSVLTWLPAREGGAEANLIII
jgi:hypothetical protein